MKLQESALLTALAQSMMDAVPLLQVRVGWDGDTATFALSFNSGGWGGFARQCESWDTGAWVSFVGDTLDELQDTISIATTNPWPAVRLHGRLQQVQPYAELVDGAIQFGYGQPPGPVLRMNPIRLPCGID